jgi:hypothetical protein
MGIFFIASASDAQKGITTKASILKNDNTTFSKLISGYLSLILIVVESALIIYFYTFSFYSLLPQSFGGAKARTVILFTNSDTLKVKLINESTNWFLLQKSDSTIIKIKSASIIKVQLDK